MEIVKSESKQQLKFEGSDLTVEATVLNGNIQEVTVTLIDGGHKRFFHLIDEQVRELDKELSNLISFVDKDKGRALS